MAADEALLGDLGVCAASARVYGWSSAWVTLGRFQMVERALLPTCAVPSVVRPTGGKAVLHGHDLTVGLAARLDDLGVEERRIGPVYRAVIRPLVAALNSVGIAAALAEETPFVRGAGKVADCFAHISPNDVVDPGTGRKVCGCALRVVRDAVLVQASVPVGAPLVDPATVFEHPALVSPEVDVSRGAMVEALRDALAKHLAER